MMITSLSIRVVGQQLSQYLANVQILSLKKLYSIAHIGLQVKRYNLFKKWGAECPIFTLGVNSGQSNHGDGGDVQGFPQKINIRL